MARKRVTIEQQLAELAKIGITVHPGITIADLESFETRDEMETEPYAGLVESLGYDIERRPFTPKCDRLWMCDYERIVSDGDYVQIIERLERMTGRALGLADIRDRVDLEANVAWVEFVHRGQRMRWDAKVEDDWMDPRIVANYDELLGSAGAPVRIYSNYTDYGQVEFFAAFTAAEKQRFDRLCKIRLLPIADQR